MRYLGSSRISYARYVVPTLTAAHEDDGMDLFEFYHSHPYASLAEGETGDKTMEKIIWDYEELH